MDFNEFCNFGGVEVPFIEFILTGVSLMLMNTIDIISFVIMDLNPIFDHEFG